MFGMLWGIVVVLVVLWLLGLLFLKSVGLVIHILLIAAVILLLYNLIVGARGRRTL